jgi:hypothetical protein
MTAKKANNRFESARVACPTRKGNAPLLAAQAGRYAGKSPSNHCQGSEWSSGWFGS